MEWNVERGKGKARRRLRLTREYIPFSNKTTTEKLTFSGFCFTRCEELAGLP
jgi:hypothetical protein